MKYCFTVTGTYYTEVEAKSREFAAKKALKEAKEIMGDQCVITGITLEE